MLRPSAALILGLVLIGLHCREGRNPELNLRLRSLAEMATIQYTLTKVIRFDNSRFYQDRKILFEIRADVKAGIDLNRIRVVSNTKPSIIIELPPARLLTLNIPPENIEEKYSSVGIFRSSFSAEERERILSAGEAEIRRTVNTSGMLKSAEEETRRFITDWLHLAGYSEIRFVNPGGKR